MRRIMLIVAYDGTNYCGWQVQPDAPTIEGVLNTELSKLLKEDIHVIGASRTDAGVHALGAVAVFDTDSTIPGDRFAFALNPFLPEDVKIVSSKDVASDFHPRKVNCRKTYEYHIYNNTFHDPTKRLYSHLVHGNLNVELMKQASRYFVGQHDFASFMSAGSQVESTIRTIFDISVKREEKNIIIAVTGNGFLYNMVRIIAGTLIEIGLEKYPPEKVEEMLKNADRKSAGQTAPANGLFLVGYEFE